MISNKNNTMGDEDSKLNNVADDQATTIDDFLAKSEQRAYRMAYIATSNKDDALDIVQDAMITLVTKYSAKKNVEWPPLFYRILQNTIRDWYRRQGVRNRLRLWFGMNEVDTDFESDQDWESKIMRNASNVRSDPTVDSNQNEKAIQQLIIELNHLPYRQQQTFLLRCWEGLDVKQTALAMNISAGSVKTHYSRATSTLRKKLGDYYEA